MIAERMGQNQQDQALSHDVVVAFTEWANEINIRYLIDIQPYSTTALDELAKQSDAKKLELINLANSSMKLMNEFKSNYSETELVKYFFNQSGYSVSDELWSKISDHNIIEVYSIEMIQLFRSFNFFKYCGYSILDLSVFDWSQLWERPKIVVEQMKNYAIDVLFGKSELCKVVIPKHLIRETLSTGLTSQFTSRVCHMSFDYIAPIYQNQKVAGFIVTSSGELVVEGKKALDMHFI